MANEQTDESILTSALKEVDRTIADALQSKVALINQVSEYAFSTKGKRIRTKLALLASLQHGPLSKEAVYNAAAIELLHTATLLHDDVVDGSTKRRKRTAANILWGNSTAVLSGDFLYAIAFQLLVKTNSIHALALVAQGARDITEAEVWQLATIGKIDLKEDEYYTIISGKTASLFSASMSTGTHLGGGSAESAQQAAAFGHHLGLAFQLTDDLLDYRGTPPHWTKEVGDDLSEAKITHPLISFLKDCSHDQKQQLTQLFCQHCHHPINARGTL